MREYSVPVLVESSPDTNTTDLLLEQAAKPSNPALFAVRSTGDSWTNISATEFLADVTRIAKGLIASGIGAGDRVGIMARTRYEWTLVDFAIWFAGAVPVPVYETSSPAQVAWILGDSEASAIIVEAARHENVVRQAAADEDLSGVKHVWQLDGGGLDQIGRASCRERVF